MLTHELTATSPTQLLEVRDWQNAAAWLDFYCRYDRMVFGWCRAVVRDPAMADDIRTEVWAEVAYRMRTFQYDPQQRFRGWLRLVCRSRIVDSLRKRQREAECVQVVEDAVLGVLADDVALREARVDESDTSDPVIADLRRAAEAVQQAARRRIGERTWSVFWQIAIADRPIAEVAREFGMTYAAAYAAYKRATLALREEGERLRHGCSPRDYDNRSGSSE